MMGRPGRQQLKTAASKAVPISHVYVLRNRLMPVVTKDVRLTETEPKTAVFEKTETETEKY